MHPVRYRHIAIEGNIGAGKTTLATLLATHLDARLILEEFADNNFLPKFYADPEQYALPLELSFLTDRYKQLKELTAAPELSAQHIVTDYLFIKSRLFARINLPNTAFELFARVFDVMNLHLPQPDVLLYLYAPVSTLQARIRKRGRDYEQEITDTYLQQVSSEYENYLATLRLPVVMIDMSKLSFTDNPVHLKALLGLLSGALQAKKHHLLL